MRCHIGSIVVPLVLIYFLFPVEITGHMGAVLRAKSGTGKSSPLVFTDSGERAFNIDWDSDGPNEVDDQSYNPYLGSSAISNIPNFFKHLRENIGSISGKGLELSNKRNSVKCGVVNLRNGYRQKRQYSSSKLDADAGNEVIILMKENTATVNSLSRNCRNVGIWNRNLFCVI